MQRGDRVLPRVVARRYEIGEVLSEGPTATVYEAVDLHLQRPVAVKIFKKKQIKAPEAVQRFLDNARAGADLSHPNVIATYDAGVAARVPYVVEERVDGERLSELIRNSAPLRPDRIRRIGAQIASVLDYLQRRNGVNYYISSDDILVTPRDEVKVLSFLPPEEPETVGWLTSQDPWKFRLGEDRVRHRHQVSPAVRSLGVTLYEMATGRSPFGNSQSHSSAQDAQEPVIRPTLHNPALPDNLERIILGALDGEAERRFRSVSELGVALKPREFAQDADVDGSAPARMDYPVAFSEPRRQRTRPRWQVAMLPAVLVITLLAAITGASALRPRLEVPGVAAFVSGPDARTVRDQDMAQEAAGDLERAIVTINSNSSRLNSMLSGLRDKLTAEMSILNGMRSQAEDMRQSAPGVSGSALPASLAAKKQSLELAYSSFQSARDDFDATAKDLEFRLRPMEEDVIRAEVASARLSELLASSPGRLAVQPNPGDERAAISQFQSAMENAVGEIERMRKTEAELAEVANAIRDQAAALGTDRGSSPVAHMPANLATPTAGRAVASATALPQHTAIPQPEATPGPAASPTQANSTALPIVPAATRSPAQIPVSGRFRPLSDRIQAQVGQALENERLDPATGNIVQSTSGGLLIWKSGQNTLYFTDGFATWVLGPRGFQFRHNDELLDWERGANSR